MENDSSMDLEGLMAAEVSQSIFHKQNDSMLLKVGKDFLCWKNDQKENHKLIELHENSHPNSKIWSRKNTNMLRIKRLSWWDGGAKRNRKHTSNEIEADT